MKTFSFKRIIPQLWFTLFFILVTALILGTFCDLYIAQMILQPNFPLSSFVDATGKMFGYLLLVFSSMILFHCVRKSNRVFALLLQWAYMLAIPISLFLMCLDLFEPAQPLLQFVWSGITTIIGSAICLFISFRLPNSFCKQLEKWAWITFLFVFITVLFVFVGKFLFGRVRFNDLNAANLYQSWYHIDLGGKGDSFPSGHTALAACSIMIPLLLHEFIHKKPILIVAWVLCIAWICFVPTVRMISGNHYLSDVVVSLIFVFALFNTLCYIFRYPKEKRFLGETWFQQLFCLGTILDTYKFF